MKPLKEITTVTDLSKIDFCNNYFDKGIPVLIKGGAKDTTPFKTWTSDYLQFVVGSKVVEVMQSKNGVFNYHKGEVNKLFMPFDEAIDFLSKNNSVYIQMASIVKDYPELLADVEDHPFIEKTDINRQTNFWFGGAGCVSPLHFDGMHNFLVQIMGRKEVTLFSPDDTKYLYPNDKGEFRLSQISIMDLDNPDYDAFPLARNAQPYIAKLDAGDVLFMPINWWHHVRSMTLNVSINFWWNRFEFVDGLGFESADDETIKSIIQGYMDNGYHIDHRNSGGETNLMRAADKGNLNIVKALLDLGASPNLKSKKYEGKTAASIASERGFTEIVNLLNKKVNG